MEATGWNGIGAPKGTPVEILDLLNKEINAALADPKMKSRLADLGASLVRTNDAINGVTLKQLRTSIL